MRVRDVVGTGRPVFTIAPEAPLYRAVDLLLEHEIGALPVVDDAGGVIGILSERDVARALHAHGVATPHLPVTRVMRRPPPTCDIDDRLAEVTDRMTRERARHLIVRDGPRIAAVLSVGDVVKHQLEQLRLESGVLRDVVAAQRARV